MSIQYMDNFSIYGTDENNMLDGLPWADLGSSTAATLENDPDGSSGKVIKLPNIITSVMGAGLRLALPTPSDTIGIAERLYVTALPIGNSNRPCIGRFATVGNSTIVCFFIEPNGALSISKADASGEATSDLVVVETTATPVVATNSWFHYEIKYTSSTGDYEVRIEGDNTPVLTGTVSGPRSTANIGIISWWGTANTGLFSYMKDLVIWDGLGSVNNDFLSTVSVFSLPVNGDVSSGWTRSTGSTDYGLLDETDPNDADYISADDTPPAASIMNFTNLPADIVSVRGLMTMVRAKKSDGGDADLVVSLISNGDTDAGSTHHVTTSYKYWIDVSELDPDTASLWTPTGVNAATIKIDRTV